MAENLSKILTAIYKNPQGITAERFSIINGNTDFTEYSEYILNNVESIVNSSKNKANKGSDIIQECIAKIIVAEVYYQNDYCYKALVLVNSVIPFLEKENSIKVWVVAKYIQMCVMIVEGQLDVIYPMVDSMKDKIYETEDKNLINNYEALRCWCALYDDAYEDSNKWVTSGSPNEYQEIGLEDTFQLFVKARVLFAQEKYLAMITLIQSMLEVLESKARYMELCEAYMLMSMGLFYSDEKEEAYSYLNKAIDIASGRQIKRLFADEGEPLYRILKQYIEDNGIREQSSFEGELLHISKKMIRLYPRYLKSHRKNSTSLSKKEIEVLELMGAERTNSEIADLLGCSTNTVKFHAKNIFRKLGVNSRMEAVRIGREEQFIKRKG